MKYGIIPKGPAAKLPSCRIGETLVGGHCELPGEVEFVDVLLCERHADQFEARDRVDLLRGIASSLELVLRSIPLHKNANLTSLVRNERAWATRELGHAHENLRRAMEETPAKPRR